MTSHQKAILSAIPDGRFYRVSEVQRLAAMRERMIFPRQSVAIVLGLLAKAGHVERALVGGKEQIFRRAQA